MNAYGLTGAGLLFVNSTLKVQLRLQKAAAKFAKLTEDLRARPVSEAGLKLVENSWFTVKHVRDQYVYLQLDQNDYTEEYNGVVFKVKFQHMQARREFLLAKLLNLYTFLDRNKFLALAYFWLFFLKTNGFVGEKRGWLSATTYLLMLVNYLQQQYLLPSFQDRGQTELVVSPADHMSLERLNARDAQRLKTMLTVANVEALGQEEDSVAAQHIEIDCFINSEPRNKQLLLDNMVRARGLMGRAHKQPNESILIKFFKYLAINLPQRNTVFDVKKGGLIYRREERRKGLLVSVKDPFVRELNHGVYLQDEVKLKLLVTRIKEFIIEASKGRIEDFLRETFTPEDPEEEESQEA